MSAVTGAAKPAAVTSDGSHLRSVTEPMARHGDGTSGYGASLHLPHRRYTSSSNAEYAAFLNAKAALDPYQPTTRVWTALTASIKAAASTEAAIPELPLPVEAGRRTSRSTTSRCSTQCEWRTGCTTVKREVTRRPGPTRCWWHSRSGERRHRLRKTRARSSSCRPENEWYKAAFYNPPATPTSSVRRARTSRSRVQSRAARPNTANCEEQPATSRSQRCVHRRRRLHRPQPDPMAHSTRAATSSNTRKPSPAAAELSVRMRTAAPGVRRAVPDPACTSATTPPRGPSERTRQHLQRERVRRTGVPFAAAAA